MTTTYNTLDGIPVAPWIQAVLDELDAICARNRASDEEVARLVGMTVKEFDADTTAPDPDPGAEEEQAR